MPWWSRIRARRPAAGQPRAIGYVHVRDDSDVGSIKACCKARGLTLATVVHDDGGAQRPSLGWALEQLAAESATVLVVARLRDLSSTVADLAPLLRWFDSERRTLIAIDLDLDTSTDAGRLAIGAIADVVAWEHERFVHPHGTPHGRAAVADVPELQRRIASMRQQGMTLQAIADVLNAEGVPTLRGGALWRPSSVQRATGYRRPSAGRRGIELPPEC